MFALQTLTPGTVRTFNLRTEKHGDKDVTAMDLGVRITGSSSLLDMLHSNLREMLYFPPDPQQASIPGESAPWTVLRCDAAKSIHVKHELVGLNVVLEPSTEIESELSDGDALALGSCNVNAFKVTARPGGSVDIDFRIQTNDIDAAAIGKAGAMLSQDVKISVTHTELPEEPAEGEAKPDGAPPDKDATGLFVDGAATETKPGDPDHVTWSFPEQPPTGFEAPPQSVTVEHQHSRKHAARPRIPERAGSTPGAIGERQSEPGADHE